MPFSPTTDGGTTAKTYTSTFDNSFASLLFTDSLSQKPPYVALSRSTLLRWTQAMSAHDVTVYRLRYLDGKFTVTVAPFFASGASSGKFSWNYKVRFDVDWCHIAGNQSYYSSHHHTSYGTSIRVCLQHCRFHAT
eukprot:m.176205 g.176205  ORF g.176205 m.176205 type:complete len:135 (-) comp14627_c0_seq23:72-476(-)